MSGVVTPPPRPPRPYLPQKKDGLATNESSVTPKDQLSKPEVLRRSYTYSSGRDRPPRPLRPDMKERSLHQISNEKDIDISYPERQSSPNSIKDDDTQLQKLPRPSSPMRKSSSTSAKDDLELRRWSYGFENKGSSQFKYRPRAPPPCPTSRQLSLPEPNNSSVETERASQQDPQGDFNIQRRSYTFGSAKSLPSYPMHSSRQKSRSSSVRGASLSPERQTSQEYSTNVNSMGTPIEKSYSAGSSLNKSTVSRPSRPPPPRAKTLPRATSLSGYKNQRDKVLPERRQHSMSTTESNSVTRPLSPQRAPSTSSAKQSDEDLNVANSDNLLVDTGNNGPPGGVSVPAATSETPVIPPRPFRPPRPFPPGKGGTGSPGRAKGTQRKHKKQPQVQSIRKSHKQDPSYDQAPSTDSTTEMQPVEFSPEHDADAVFTNDNCHMEDKEPPVTKDLAPSSNLELKLSQNNEVPAQETTKFEEATAVEPKEEDDQISPLPGSNSPRSRGNKFFKSMKKSFRSLRSPNRKRKQMSTRYSRPNSENDLPLYDETGKYPDPLPQGIVHPLVVQCVAYLNKESVLKEEGLFRVPGDVAAIKRLRERFISGSEVNLAEVVDPHTVAGLLKLHFREQRVSMIPRGQPLASITQAVKDKDVESVREVINGIDISHIAMLRLVAELLAMVVSFSEENKMSSGTLATSCAPSIFPYLPTSSAVIVMKFLIDHCAEVFQQ